MEDNSPENTTRAGWPNCRVPDSWEGSKPDASTALLRPGHVVLFVGGLAIVLAMGYL